MGSVAISQKIFLRVLLRIYDWMGGVASTEYKILNLKLHKQSINLFSEWSDLWVTSEDLG